MSWINPQSAVVAFLIVNIYVLYFGFIKRKYKR